MRSAANIRGHPIHPMLIPFPLAFLIGAFVFDVAGQVTGHAAWWTTGGHLAIVGVAAALVAAVPGLIDYRRTVPPQSSGKRRATMHLSLNLSAVALFVVATWLRHESGSPAVVLIIEGVAAALLGVGGWHGGVLVSRNQISVDHRYANAGKWREASVAAAPSGTSPARDGITVAARDELKPNQMKLLRVGDRRFVLARTDDGYVCFDDRCTHRGGSLAGGMLACGIVQCPWHGSQFDVRTGAVRSGPARDPIRTYTVEERDGEVRLIL
jgi:nitrite reductase/ring-hydroxylating ferredoxin subunit/uncharacterized membrane protein